MRRSRGEAYAAIYNRADGRDQERHDEIHPDLHEKPRGKAPPEETSPSFTNERIQPTKKVVMTLCFNTLPVNAYEIAADSRMRVIVPFKE